MGLGMSVKGRILGPVFAPWACTHDIRVTRGQKMDKKREFLLAGTGTLQIGCPRFLYGSSETHSRNASIGAIDARTLLRGKRWAKNRRRRTKSMNTGGISRTV